MTYNVFSGTLNLTQSINQPSIVWGKAYLDEQFLQFSELGFVSLGPFTVPRFFCVYVCVFALCCHIAHVLYYCNTVEWTWWD